MLRLHIGPSGDPGHLTSWCLGVVAAQVCHLPVVRRIPPIDYISIMEIQEKTTPLDRLVDEIVERVKPLRIVLFGSAARGDVGVRNDLDLLVVVQDGTHRRETAQKLYREISGIGVPFDLVVATRGDLERHADNKGLIYRTALQEGREVYAA